MDKDTEIASKFTVGRYEEIRGALNPAAPDNAEWQEILGAFERRIQERFLRPIKELEGHDEKDRDQRPTRAGFAIMILDCVLIDTIQSFREGREVTGEKSSAKSFKTFLKSYGFSEFKSKDRQDFVEYIRHALVHNGETRKNWKIRISTNGLLEKDRTTGTRIINRRIFHCRVEQEFQGLCAELKSFEKSSEDARRCFLRRMDALCGLSETTDPTV